MSLSVNDYLKLYKLQDKVFNALSGHYGTLYLTGGTALGRFYLKHRYSDDIDLFANTDDSFKGTVTKIRHILDSLFNTPQDKLILYDDYIRIWIEDNNCELKIEFVNDVAERWGKTLQVNNIPVDNPGNILANKLTALISRDEPKDVFDIINISLNYSFNWGKVFEQSIRKAIIAEQDVPMRLETFPVELIASQPWLIQPVNIDKMKAKLETITDDFLFARDNSLGVGKVHITEAEITLKG
ncbi:MAG: nucleotidyl transferase AbiEii/AbiGii toxin family protein [Bacteroidota bacterium]